MMEGELEEHLKLLMKKEKFQLIIEKKNLAAYQSILCKDFDLNLISSGMDDFIKSFEINIYIYIVKANELRESTFFGKISMDFYSVTWDKKHTGCFITSHEMPNSSSNINGHLNSCFGFKYKKNQAPMLK